MSAVSLVVLLLLLTILARMAAKRVGCRCVDNDDGEVCSDFKLLSFEDILKDINRLLTLAIITILVTMFMASIDIACSVLTSTILSYVAAAILIVFLGLIMFVLDLIWKHVLRCGTAIVVAFTSGLVRGRMRRALASLVVAANLAGVKRACIWIPHIPLLELNKKLRIIVDKKTCMAIGDRAIRDISYRYGVEIECR